MPKPHITCVILLPVGPGIKKEYLLDTLESIDHYMGNKACRIAILDDSRSGELGDIQNRFKNVDLFEAARFDESKTYHIFGFLFAKQMIMLKQILDSYTFDVLLRIDTDSLIIGPNVQQDAVNFFHAHPQTGMAGAFQRRGDGTIKKDAMKRKGDEIRREMIWYKGGYRQPKLMKVLQMFMKKAIANGYTPGDMCTGGGFFISYPALQAIFKNDIKDILALSRSRVTDDALFSFLCFAGGYCISDMPDDNDVLAINWRGLPMPLEELAASNKKIVHPIKSDDPSFEAGVRHFFRERRATNKDDKPTPQHSLL